MLGVRITWRGTRRRWQRSTAPLRAACALPTHPHTCTHGPGSVPSPLHTRHGHPTAGNGPRWSRHGARAGTVLHRPVHHTQCCTPCFTFRVRRASSGPGTKLSILQSVASSWNKPTGGAQPLRLRHPSHGGNLTPSPKPQTLKVLGFKFQGVRLQWFSLSASTTRRTGDPPPPTPTIFRARTL